MYSSSKLQTYSLVTFDTCIVLVDGREHVVLQLPQLTEITLNPYFQTKWPVKLVLGSKHKLSSNSFPDPLVLLKEPTSLNDLLQQESFQHTDQAIQVSS